MHRPSHSSPPMFLIPSDTTDLSTNLQGDRKHFITAREFHVWAKSHPSIRPTVPPPAGPSSASETPSATQGSNRPSQHSSSHILRTIPPRAPSRSTRSNILAYSLHLATTSLLASYTSSSTLLHRAEACDGDDLEALLPAARDAEAKADGLWKLAASLLRESNRAGELPPSVERRVELARLAEGLLSSVVPPSTYADPAVVVPTPADTVPALATLLPLTSPASAAPGPSAPNSHTRIAQSLLDMKFGGAGDDEPAASTSSAFGGSAESANKLTALPHMDYRIVRGQAMRSRAKVIFGTSVLSPHAEATAVHAPRRWCRRHRVASCVVCSTATLSHLLPSGRSKTAVAGSGLLSLATSGSKPTLASLIPTFLILSSTLLSHLRSSSSARAAPDPVLSTFLSPSSPSVSEEDEGELTHVTAGWYALLHELVIQSCLEGYLVEGWEGTGGIEVLFGVGCGVWEGRAWVTVPPTASSVGGGGPEGRAAARRQAEQLGEEGTDGFGSSEGDSESDDEEEDELEREREREEKERDRITLVRAAQKLFGTRDIAQADFERSMRDRAHEFLDVPESSTLAEHLTALNKKYPLSAFEHLMVEFIDATAKLLGKPALAKYEAAASATTTTATVSGEPDVYALARFFGRPESDPLMSLMIDDEGPSPVDVREGKRRRLD